MSVGLDEPVSDGGTPAGRLKVGKYQLLAILGRGGMADVFLALARGPAGFNKLAVVKRLRGSLADDAHFREMFLDEARLAARLNHPNVVHTYEVGAEDDVYFIAMEYLEGQSLNKIIKEGLKRELPFDQVFCARIVSDALAGLHHAHELKDYDGTPLRIIHRDVSPHNIFVTYDGIVKVVDFGIAKAALSSAQTEVGVLKGKVAYMSPEQAGGSRIDARADIFAMGIVLWELLTKQRLMQGDSAAATLHRLMMEPITPIAALRTDIDPELENILTRSLEKEPIDRFQTAQEMRDALDAYIASTGRTLRTDDIGRQISGMFQKVRDEIGRQIQRHMQSYAAPTGPATTSELSALSVSEAPKKVPVAPSSGGQLPMLNASSGSGSGVVANLAAPAPGFETFPPAPLVPTGMGMGPRQRKPVGLWLWGMVGLVLGLIAIVALRARPRPTEGPSPAVASPSPVQTTAFVDPPLDRAAVPAPPPTPIPSQVPSPAGVGASGVGATGVGASAPPAVATSEAAPVGDATRPPAAGDQANAGTGHTQHWPRQPHVTTLKPPTAPAAPPPPAAPADDVGYLTFDTYPWTKVSENGRALGTTPLVRVALPPGAHTLTLENPDQGIKQSYSVTIKPGDTSSHRLGLK